MGREKIVDLPTLATERLLLRALRLEDVADQHAYARDPAVAEPGMWDPLPTLEDNRCDLVDSLARGGRGESAEWGIEHRGTGRLVGRCGLSRIRSAHRSAELGYALARP